MPTENFQFSRKTFLKLFGFTGFGLLSSYFGIRKFFTRNKYNFTGKISGANFKSGHLLRTEIQGIPKETISIETIIVGGGISGLSAGWYLQKKGYKDFLLLEMDSNVGGNSQSGENSISKYPYGAHYVPLPGIEASYVKEFFEDIGIIEGYKNSLPIYNEYYLCSDPNERLYFQGQWQEGLVPTRGIQAEDRKQYNEFFAFIESLKLKRGNDNKPLFTIPMEFSSKDIEYVKLDKISMFDIFNQKDGIQNI